MKDHTIRVAGRSLISLTLRNYYNDILRSSSSKLNMSIPTILSDMQLSLDLLDIYTQYKKYVMLVNDRTVDVRFTSGELVLNMYKTTHIVAPYSPVRFPLQIVSYDHAGQPMIQTVHSQDVISAWNQAAKVGLITRLTLKGIQSSARYIQDLFVGLALINLDDTRLDRDSISILQRNFTLGRGLFIIGTKEQSALNGERFTNNELKYNDLARNAAMFRILIETNWVEATYDNER